MSKSTKYDRDILLNELRENILEVSFDKINNQPRILRCTLMEYFLPQNYKKSADDKYHATNPDILAVWDIDNKGWRAFRIDSVKMVQALDPYLFK